MKEVVELLVKALVDHPEEIEVTEGPSPGPNTVRIEVYVPPGDAGKVIGRQGRIANAIRTVANAAASRQNRKVVVDILS